jgi:hypothetical protein
MEMHYVAISLLSARCTQSECSSAVAGGWNWLGVGVGVAQAQTCSLHL